MKWVTEIENTLEQNQEIIDTTMKRVVKNIYWELIIYPEEYRSKRAQMEKVCAVTKKMFKAGKVLTTTVQRVNLKTLYTVFCYNLYHLMILNIKSILKIAETIFKIRE